MELVILRNKILAKKFGENEKNLLTEIKKNLNESKKSVRELILFCLANIENDVAAMNFESASAEAQLIHNFPLTNEDIKRWDEEHFYLFELRSYLNKMKDAARIKKIVKLISLLEIN